MSAMEWFGRAPALPAMEAGKARPTSEKNELFAMRQLVIANRRYGSEAEIMAAI
jgi:hypothetical protein